MPYISCTTLYSLRHSLDDLQQVIAFLESTPIKYEARAYEARRNELLAIMTVLVNGYLDMDDCSEVSVDDVPF